MGRVLLLLCLLAAPAAADSVKAEFAKGMRIEESAILDVQDFSLKAGPYHRAIVGRFEQGEYTVAGAVLTWCDRKEQCWLAREWLRSADEVEVLGLVDLGGAAAKFPTHGITKYERKALSMPKAKWPALLVRMTERKNTTTSSRYGGSKTGTHRRVELAVLSLAIEDTRNPAVMRETVDEHWPTGAGHYTSLEVTKPGELLAIEQRDLESTSMCIRPKPTTTRYVFDKETRRFKEAGLPARTGC